MKKYLIPMALLFFAGPAYGEIVEMVTEPRYVFDVKKEGNSVKLHIVVKRYVGDDDCILTISQDTANSLAKELLEAAK